MIPAKEGDDIEFKWGKKRGLGGKKKDVQFYESFTYDGVEYMLYDSVYMYADDEIEPYIGKIIKIWENADKTKRVKVLWFFRPCEISNYLEGNSTSKNELFLACGEGVGLANVNPLEAIAGKCNVICTSKDSRNPQPSKGELQMADFIFSRVFNVSHCVILDKIDDKIAQVDVKFLLNKVNSQQSTAVSVCDSIRKEISGNVVAADDIELLSKTTMASGECRILKADGSSIVFPPKENAGSNVLLADLRLSVGQKLDYHACEGSDEMFKFDHTKGNFPGEKTTSKFKVQDNAEAIAPSVMQKPPFGEKLTSNMVGKLSDEAKTSEPQGKLSNEAKTSEPQEKPDNNVTSSSNKGEEIAGPKLSLIKQKSSLGDGMDNNKKQESMFNEKITSSCKDAPVRCDSKRCADSVNFANRSLKKDKHDGSFKVSDGDKEKNVQKLVDDSNCCEAMAVDRTTTSSINKSNCKPAKDLDDAELMPCKKKKLSEKLTKFRNRMVPRESPTEVPDEVSSRSGSKGCNAKPVDQTATAYEDKLKRKLVKDPHETQIVSSKKPKLEEKLTNFANRKSPRESPREVFDDVSKTGSKVLEVTRRPEAEKSKWFKGLPWEERIQSAHAEGKLVLLQNLDPSYTGAEVEDIVWHALKQNCTAKMIPHIGYSSPHTGQAFAIFKTKYAAEMTVTKLEEGCLVMSNRRPLIGSIAKLSSLGRPSTFFGHISIDRTRHQMQREMREAVSTSHCSQPNTIEYDMALDWCLLQERTNLEWEQLYKQHGKELRKLEVALKLK